MGYRLTPELDVSDFEASLSFYMDTIGFKLKYNRTDEGFAYLELDGVPLMLQQAEGPGRRFRTAPLEKPYGRGINFQIEVADVEKLNSRLKAINATFVIPLEEKWYRAGDREVGNHQFVVADPDGYLLRFSTDLGFRSLSCQNK